MKKVSVIIPVYNSEQYVEQCVLSVVQQTYPNLQILIIDDGSTDHSLDICQRLGERDSRIQIFCQENKGVSSARNKGIDQAEGDYLFFLDSDDSIHPLLIEEGVKQAETHHTELVLYRCLEQDTRHLEEQIRKISIEDERPQWQIVEHEELKRWFHTREMLSLMRVGGLLRRDCIGSQRFNETLAYGEDTLFMYHMISKPIRMSYSKQGWYYYRIYPESVSHSLSAMENRNYFQYAKVIRDREYQKDHLVYAMAWERIYLRYMKKTFLKMKEVKNKTRYRELKRQAAVELRSPLFRRVSFERKLLFMACFYTPALYRVLDNLRQMYHDTRKPL